MKKILALDPNRRDEECDHTDGGHYTGEMPCTGNYVCNMCGTILDPQNDVPIDPNNKWQVTLSSIVAAPTRNQAWQTARQIFGNDLDDIASVVAIPYKPVHKPEEWIAVNQIHPQNKALSLLLWARRQQ